MKTVSKLFTAAAIAFAAVACQVIDEGQIVTRQIEVTATIAEDDESKVDYDVVNDDEKKIYTISPTWHLEGTPDQIIGFDNLGNTFTFTVSGISDNGKIATFRCSYVPPTGATTLYAIYAPGNDSTDISDKTLSVDLSAQGGALNGDAPVLMCATATIKDGKVNFQFTNQTAIIGVKKFQLNGVSSATEVTSMTLYGVVTEGKFSIDGESGKLTLKPTGSAASITATGSWETNDSGICTTSVYFAAMPTTGADMTLTAATATATYDNLSSIKAVDIVAGRYYHMTKKLGHPVAEIGRERYDSINAAFEAADASTDACTITLLDDCSTSSTLNIQTLGKGAVTLDLNGKTLNCSTSSAYINVLNNRDFTITDNSNENVADQGTIQTSEANYVVRNYGGSLTIARGNISSTRNYYAIYTSGTATISGGKIYSTHTGVYVESGSLNISGGEIESTNQCVYNCGTTNISGGTFISTSTETAKSDGSSAIIYVTGGYFSSESTSVELFTIASSGTCYVTGGYFDRPIPYTFARTATETKYRNALTNDNTYPYIVEYSASGMCFVIVGTKKYVHSNLQSALSQSSKTKSDVTIQLRGKHTPPAGSYDLTNTEGHTITLDLNSYTLTAKDESFITTSGKLKITDNSTKKGGTISSNYNKVISINVSTANVDITDCKIVSTFSTASQSTIYHYGGKIAITDAVITSKNRTIYSGKGTLTITNSTLTSDVYCLYVNGPTSGKGTDVTINSGSLYSGANNVIYINANNSTVTIKGGYYYIAGSTSVLYSSDTATNCFTIEGGLYNKALNSRIEASTGYLNVVEIATKTHDHDDDHTNLEYTYGYIAQ